MSRSNENTSTCVDTVTNYVQGFFFSFFLFFCTHTPKHKIIIIINIYIAPFCRRYKALLPIIMISGKSSQSFRFTQGTTGQVHTLSTLRLYCNISHDQYLPDALRSTKQLKQSILPKDTNMLTLVGFELTV